VVIWIDDLRARARLDVTCRDRTGLIDVNLENRLVDVVV